MEEDQPDQPYHVPFAFRVGQRVVVKDARPVAHAWYGEDINETAASGGSVNREAHVGVRHKIESEHPLYGFYCSAPKYTSLWYPSCALEPDNKACIIEVPSVNEDLKGGN